MRRILAFYRSSLGKKVVMAVTGIMLVGFIVGHMVGNLKAFQGAEKLNSYAEFLREVGYPIFGHGELLWIMRGGLIVALVLHILSATQLALQARAARPVKYQKGVHLEDSYASRTMRWGGVIIFLFVLYHLAHLTVGSAHPNFVTGEVYGNLVVGFQAGWPVAIYSLAVVLLGFHLYHGIWSAIQTLGLNQGDPNRWRGLSAAFAILIVIGFLTVPAAVLAGIIN